MTLTSTSTTSTNKVFCLVGPSGTGKSAIAANIPLPSVVSYRTRDPRDGEVDGVDGHFITKEKFLSMKEQDLWIAETDYAYNYYGITQGELIELEDKPMLYVIDWPGVITLQDAFEKLDGYSPNDIVSIYVHTPRMYLEARMIKQGRKRDEVKVRLDRADRDYAFSDRCDYVVENVNGSLDKTVADVMKIILKESF